ncbi:MAG TPA: NrfD/PsrC family molybdoenzyme membrane anchor subunit [Candidatus Deferrimicrobiaceae bacterium]|jgi:formate-dependent nitrite reductase membrane component NrfD
MNPEVHIPGWEWYYVAAYFFIGGVSAGAYFIASLAELFGGEKQRAVSHAGFYLAFPLILLTPPLLIADLGRPERFWHLFLYSGNGLPIFNLQSPLSVGSWALLLFGVMAFLSFLDNLVAENRFRSAPFSHAYNRIPRKAYAVVGAAAGFFVAGYTGVLLNVTARPFWAATSPMMGALFIASAASTGAAAIHLFLLFREKTACGHLVAFHRFDRLAKIVELLLVASLIAFAGKWAAPLLRGGYAILFWGGAVLLGIVVPLAVNWRVEPVAAAPSARANWTAAFALFGGALLRISLIQAGQV